MARRLSPISAIDWAIALRARGLAIAWLWVHALKQTAMVAVMTFLKPIPGTPPGERAAPLVLVLHGAGGTAEGGLVLLQSLADEAGLLLLAPASRQRTWDVIMRGYGPDVELIALEDALQRLAALDQRKSRVVELKFFGGLTIDEITEVLGISPATVEREWAFARAWLYDAIEGAKDEG